MSSRTVRSTSLPGVSASSYRRARRADLITHATLAGSALLAALVVLAIAAFVLSEAWPSFAHNGPSWFGDSGTPLDTQLNEAFAGSRAHPGQPFQELHAWPAILGTIITTGGALAIAFPFSLLAAIFIAELAPRRLAAMLDPVVGLLAATPSVVYGLFAILVIAPWVNGHLIDPAVAERYAPVVTLSGASALVGGLVLALMIAPLMIAVFSDALRSVPAPWKEGAIALGCDRWRSVRRVSLAAIRPALVAGTSLAIGRAVGEAIALSMASGSIAFTPNPLDGLYAFVEPVRPLASSIVDYSEGFGIAALRADLFAFGAVLLVTTATLTLAARVSAALLERRLQGRG